MSTWGILVVDDSVSQQGLAPWPTIGSRVGLTASTGVVSAISWIRSNGFSHVIVLGRLEARTRTRSATSVISGALPGLAIARLDARCSLLAVAAIGHVLTRSVDEPQLAYRTLAQDAETAISGVWLRRVASLSRPSPSLWQHLRSTFPGGSGFVAQLSPDSVVVPRRRAHRIHRLHGDADAATGPAELLIGAEHDDPAAAALAHDMGFAQSFRILPPVVNVADTYGSRGVEFRVWAGVQQQLPLQTATCPVCRGQFAVHACPFCHARPAEVFSR